MSYISVIHLLQLMNQYSNIITEKVHTLFGFLSFYLMSFFCTRIPPGYHDTFRHHLLRLLQTVTVSKSFPVFDNLGSFEEYWSSILFTPHQLEFDVSLIIRLGFWLLENTEGKCHFNHIILRVHTSAWFIFADVYLDHLTGSYSGFSTVKLFFCPSFQTALTGGIHK